MQIKTKEPLKKWSWWRVGGPADYFCQPENADQLQKALLWAEKNKQKVSALGGGTNVLISDQGVEGLVISTARLNQLSFKKTKEKLIISCLSGVLKSQVMKVFKSHRLAPALFLSGLPGDVGGGLIMNAGVSRPLKPSEFSEIVHSFELMTPKGLKPYQKKDITWSYRKTSGLEKGVLYKIRMEWPLEEIKDLNERIKKEIQKRRSSQPLNKPSCGSVFKNPYPQFAGRLIEKAGLKGLTRGQARVSTRHANFILNSGSATAQEIDSLIQEIRQKVYDKFTVSLETEVHYMGRWKQPENP